MSTIYNQDDKSKIPNNIYDVQIENDLLLNLEDPEEGLRHFYRNRPPKKIKPEDKH